MNSPQVYLRIVLLSGLLGVGCSSEPMGPMGTLEFASPPPGLLRARPVLIDGRPIIGSLSRTSFDVEAGIHSVTAAPAEGGPFGEEGPPTVRVTIEVVPGGRHRLAMRQTEQGLWEVVAWNGDAP